MRRRATQQQHHHQQQQQYQQQQHQQQQHQQQYHHQQQQQLPPPPQQQQQQVAAAGSARDERPLPRAPLDVYGGEVESAAPPSGALCACDICGRSFAPDRIEKHRAACSKASSSKRKVFSGAAQRLQGLECVDVRGASREAVAQAERRKELLKAGGGGAGGGGAGGFDEAPRQRDRPRSRGGAERPRATSLGQGGRPLSPLSAAVARAKAGEDPYDEDPSLRPSSVVPCPCCGRSFASDRLQVHLAICEKVAVNSQARKVWDSSRQRLDRTSADLCALNSSPSHSPAPRRLSFSRRPSSSSFSSPDPPSRAGGGGSKLASGSKSLEPHARRPEIERRSSLPAETPSERPVPKWKRESANFQAALRAGRNAKLAQSDGGGALASLTAAEPSFDDRVPCPHCGRKFNAMAAERHIPKCTSIHAKPKMLTRGGGAGIHSASRARASDAGGGWS